MANPYEAYRSQLAASWTRADMVVALYEEAINRIDLAIEALAGRQQHESRQHGLRVLQVVACLRSGVDEEAGNLPNEFLRLYDFVNRCVTSGRRTDLENARDVLVPLRDSFDEIRDTVAKLEQAGEIPGLQLERHVVCKV